MTYIVTKTWFLYPHGINGEFETKEDVVKYFYYDFACGLTENFRILDDYDHQRVDIQEFVNVYNQIRNQRLKKHYNKFYRNHKYVFRRGPVPGIHKRTPYNNWMTYPKTKQELSQEVPTRASRKNLPTAWDDLYRTTEKNWKSQRKTQYKIVDKSTKIT